MHASPHGESGPGNVRKAGAPRGVPIACEGKALEGEAHGRSDASASGGGVGNGREEGIQTLYMALDGGGTRSQQIGTHASVCVVGHESSGEAVRMPSPGPVDSG